jgi:hypothetical protein
LSSLRSSRDGDSVLELHVGRHPELLDFQERCVPIYVAIRRPTSALRGWLEVSHHRPPAGGRSSFGHVERGGIRPPVVSGAVAVNALMLQPDGEG